MKKTIITLLVLLVLAVVAIMYFPHAMRNSGSPAQQSTSTPIAIMATTTLTGEFACLPHRDDGPSTMECAYGLKATDGLYYALDFSGTPTSAFDLPMGRPYSVTGLLVPVEMLNTNHWQQYDIKGIMKVSSYRELTAGMKAYLFGQQFTVGLKDPVQVGSIQNSGANESGAVVRVWAVTEDSRCPTDVKCIQAGTVKVAITIEFASGTSTATFIQPGTSVTDSGITLTLVSVAPDKVSTHKITDDEYRFTFVATQAAAASAPSPVNKK